MKKDPNNPLLWVGISIGPRGQVLGPVHYWGDLMAQMKAEKDALNKRQR